ncbi:hypothetical protein METY_0298 [Methylopila sp. Yamaguchi]|nr:hypothetical protein METY_0298 [Methylopila sp. Yamaguchi]
MVAAFGLILTHPNAPNAPLKLSAIPRAIIRAGPKAPRSRLPSSDICSLRGPQGSTAFYATLGPPVSLLTPRRSGAEGSERT